ncbi:FAD-binding Berberine family protein [Striga asiatica]|uniref:FAD-binding Berberine family protein n=1 Tax=Striga asiatica TaxID=4170 RepID=A0A5A7NW39_STRAF|nr:FAD-binding Berberine family protein [Striga asiatica]
MKKPNLPLFLYFLTSFAFASADNPPLYASFVQCLSEQKIPNDVASQIVSTPNTPQFSTVLNSYIRNRRFNTSATPRPGLIVAPTSEAHVSATVVCAVRLEIHLRIRSGGHDYEGTSYVSGERRFAMLDMSNFRSIDVDAAGRTAWPITRNRTRTVRATFVGQYLGPGRNLLNVTARYFPKLGLTRSSCHEMPWIQSVLYWDDRTNLTRSPEELLNRNPNSAGYLKRKSDYVKKPIPVNGLNRIFDEIIRGGQVGMVFNSYGGVNSRIPATATPFPHRDGNLFKIQYSVSWDNGSDSEDFVRQSRELYEFMTPYVSENPRQAYFNYRDLDIGVMPAGESSYGQGKVYGEKYFKENFDRLVKIKTRVDPRNFFRNEQSIPTAQRGGGDAVGRRVNA